MALYRIIFAKNKKEIKVLHQYRSLSYITALFKDLVKRNQEQKIYFPKQYNTYNELHRSKYELLLIKRKEKEETAKNISIRNTLGQIVEAKDLNDKWLILDIVEYIIEEAFYVYGHNKSTDRFDVPRIINELILTNTDIKYNIKQITLYRNKIAIKDDYDFKLVLCKCVNDAERLFELLRESLKKEKRIKIVFLIAATRYQKSCMVKLIVKNTKMRKKDILSNKTKH